MSGSIVGGASTPGSIYKTPEAEILALYDEALAGFGPDYESLTVGTRLGDTHVLAHGGAVHVHERPP